MIVMSAAIMNDVDSNNNAGGKSDVGGDNVDDVIVTAAGIQSVQLYEGDDGYAPKAFESASDTCVHSDTNDSAGHNSSGNGIALFDTSRGKCMDVLSHDDDDSCGFQHSAVEELDEMQEQKNTTTEDCVPNHDDGVDNIIDNEISEGRRDNKVVFGYTEVSNSDDDDFDLHGDFI